MHTAILNFSGTSNIGLYGFANDKYLLLGREVPETHDKELAEVFKVPIIRCTIAGTSMIGVFVAGNNEKIIVPGIIFDHEMELLKKHGVDFTVIDTKLTCLGNNVLVNDTGLLVNPEFTDAQAGEIGKIFGMEAHRTRLAGMNTVGSLVALNSKGKALTTHNITEEEFEMLQEKLDVELETGSVSMGSQHIRSGIITNKNGFVIGAASGGPEIANADEALGFLGADNE